MSILINTKRTIQLFAGMLLLLTSACSSHKSKEINEVTEPPITVRVSKPSFDGLQVLHVSGQLTAGQSANISTRVMGYITSLKVDIGDHVSKGQLLATISNQDILAKKAQADAMIAEAQAACNNARKDYERYNNLYQQQSASEKELENAALQYSTAKSKLETARQMRNEVNATLGYTHLTAPFAGTVSRKLADAGSMANPGMPILTIDGNGSFQVSASVPENEIGQVSQGVAAVIHIGAVNREIKGTVSRIDQSSQFSGSQYQIKVNIPDDEKQGLYAGMYADVSIAVKQMVNAAANEGQVLVPVTCIEHKDQLTGLYTIENNNTALLRWVRLGKTIGDRVEVLSGLAANEQFIVSADGRLFNGATVKINK